MKQILWILASLYSILLVSQQRKQELLLAQASYCGAGKITFTENIKYENQYSIVIQDTKLMTEREQAFYEQLAKAFPAQTVSHIRKENTISVFITFDPEKVMLRAVKKETMAGDSCVTIFVYEAETVAALEQITKKPILEYVSAGKILSEIA